MAIPPYGSAFLWQFLLMAVLPYGIASLWQFLLMAVLPYGIASLWQNLYMSVPPNSKFCFCLGLRGMNKMAIIEEEAIAKIKGCTSLYKNNKLNFSNDVSFYTFQK